LFHRQNLLEHGGDAGPRENLRVTGDDVVTAA
jgi:hypothetical protein